MSMRSARSEVGSHADSLEAVAGEIQDRGTEAAREASKGIPATLTANQILSSHQVRTLQVEKIERSGHELGVLTHNFFSLGDGNSGYKGSHSHRTYNRQVLKTSVDAKQKFQDALDTAKAAELALREMIGSWRAAK